MSKKLFIVDDDPDMVKVMTFRLKQAGFEIIPFTLGSEVIKHLENEIPDLFLLDVQMPDMTGHEVAKVIESNEKTKELPIIFLTGKVDFDANLNGQPKRAMFIKPCDFSELIAKINELTAS